MKTLVSLLGSLFSAIVLFVMLGLSTSGVFQTEYISVVTNPIFTGIVSPMLIIFGYGTYLAIEKELDKPKE